MGLLLFQRSQEALHSSISNNSIISRRPSGGLGAREGVGNFKSEGRGQIVTN